MMASRRNGREVRGRISSYGMSCCEWVPLSFLVQQNYLYDFRETRNPQAGHERSIWVPFESMALGYGYAFQCLHEDSAIHRESCYIQCNDPCIPGLRITQIII